MEWVLGQGLELEQGCEPLGEPSDWLECLPVGQGLEIPAMRLASLLLGVVQGLTRGKKLRQSITVRFFFDKMKKHSVFSLLKKDPKENNSHRP